MSLLDDGWTEEQAQGLLDNLNLTGGTPKWKPEHLQRLHEWCTAHGRDAASGQHLVGIVNTTRLLQGELH
jgi:hypothetical protein